MSEWKLYKIDELIDEISMGPFGSDIKKEVYTDSGVPVLNGSNLQGFKLGEDSFGYVTEEKADSLRKCNAHRGDVVVTHRGTLGQMVYIPNDSKFDRYLISQSQFRYTLKKSLARPDFVVYYFHTKEGQYKLLSNASQVGVPALARATTTFRQLEIPLPPLSVQNKIMEVLLSLDAKIENNNKINANLEAQAQALFKSWFVDFEPFQNGEFEDSELGRIPKGWKVGTLGELIEVKYGKDHKRLPDGDIPVYGSGGLMRKVDRCLYNGESVLIPRKGTLNNVMYVNEAFWTVDTMFYSIMKQPRIAIFVYQFLIRKDLASMNAGSAVPSMTSDILNKMLIVIPPQSILVDFDKIVQSLYKKKQWIKAENESLSTLRDTLLPKLMSGEIEV